MNEELAIEILKQATIETTTGACEKCPRKDKNKTCIGCLDEAKEKILLEVERLNNIINELEKDIENLYTYGIKNNAEQKDYLLNRLQELKGSDKE